MLALGDEQRIVTVDVEVQNQELIERLRAGAHSFDFLHQCPLLTEGNEDFRRLLKNRKLATGVRDDTLQTAEAMSLALSGTAAWQVNHSAARNA